jgi:hypothetical protein
VGEKVEEEEEKEDENTKKCTFYVTSSYVLFRKPIN